VVVKIQLKTTYVIIVELDFVKLVCKRTRIIMHRLSDITTVRITKNTHTELLKIMGQIQARTGKIPTLDDALKELLENYKKKTKDSQ